MTQTSRPLRMVAIGDPQSTERGHEVVLFLRQLHLRSDCELSVVSRLTPHPIPWRDYARAAVVVDDLRRWVPARLVESVVGSVWAGRLRGIRLRLLLRRLGPLDLALVLDGDGDLLSRVLRNGRVQVATVSADPATADGPDVEWVDGPAGWELRLPRIVDGNHCRGAATDEQRGERRVLERVKQGELLVGLAGIVTETVDLDRVGSALAASSTTVRVRRLVDPHCTPGVGDGWRIDERDAELVGLVAACDALVVVGSTRWSTVLTAWAEMAGVRVVAMPGPVDDVRIGEMTDRLPSVPDTGRRQRVERAVPGDAWNVAGRFVDEVTERLARR